jgi:DNA-binding IclR family transcriptional regulator
VGEESQTGTPTVGSVPSADPAGYHIRAVQRVCDILDHLRDSTEGATLPDLAEVVRLPKSSVFRYLVTLEARRYVERDGGGVYRLGIAFVPPQQHQIGILADLVRPYLEQLQETLGETASLGVLDGGRVVLADVVESRRAVRLVAAAGEHAALHATALGKAISANLPEGRVRKLLAAEGMSPLTGNTITDTDSYLEEIAQVRRRGFALDDGESESDGRSIAVPVDGTSVKAAMAVSAPAGRLSLERAAELADSLTRLSRRFSAELTVPLPR